MKKKITIIVPDLSDARTIKRVNAFKILGANLVVCGFKRNRYSYDSSNYDGIRIIELGKTAEKKYLRRIIKLTKGISIILSNSKIFKNSNCIYCINIDMLLIGVILKLKSNVKLYYEVGDILNEFLGYKFRNKIIRRFERLLLNNVNLLILTSPSFYYSYYNPIQNYKRNWILLENKLLPLEKPYRNGKSTKSEKIKIVIHGVLRCQKSIDMLIKIAQEYSDKCELHIHGFPLWVRLNDLVIISQTHENIFWHGEFKYPEGLTNILSNADLLWLIDLSENSKNAEWLLPNRLYDGLFFRVPMLAISNTETGNYIKKMNIGWCLGKEIYNDLKALIEKITAFDIDLKKNEFNKQSDEKSCSYEQHEMIYDSI